MASASTSQDLDTAGTVLRQIYSAPGQGAFRPSTLVLTNLPPKTKSVRAACEPCRKKKNKCTGERPQCAPCLVRGTQCRYETAGAETHSQARKRKYDELQNEAATLKELFLIISTVTEEQSREIVRLIRAGAEPESLLRLLQNGDLPAQMDLVPNTALHYEFPYISSMPGYLLSSDNVYLRSQIYDASVLGVKPPYLLTPSGNGLHIVGDDAPYLKPYHLAQVADDRFHNIMASRWTRVTSDNKLLVRLLDAYFMHAYPAFPAFQKDLFLDDMVSGRDRFCSELLVNAVLAHACHCYRPLAGRSTHWTTHTLAYRFITEAKRLWELEDVAGAKLTTIQAAMVLNVIYNSNGTDRIGSILLQRAVDMARELQLFSFSAYDNHHLMTRARNFTAWCLFIWQVMHGYYFFKAPLLEHPPQIPLPDTQTGADFYGEILLRYPHTTGLTRLHFPDVFKTWANLRVLVNEISVELFGERRAPSHQPRPLSREKLQYFRRGLDAWYQNLPESLKPNTIALPCHLRIHMEYYSTLCGLYQTQLRAEPNPPPPVTSGTPALSVQSLCSPVSENPMPPSRTLTAVPTGPVLAEGPHKFAAPQISSFLDSTHADPIALNQRMPFLPVPTPAGTLYTAATSAASPPRRVSFAPTSPTISVASLSQTPGTVAYGRGSSVDYAAADSPPSQASRRHSLTLSAVLSPATVLPGATAAAATTSRPTSFSERKPTQNGTFVSPDISGTVRTRVGSQPSIDDIMAHLMKCFETLVRLYYLRHSFDYYDSFLIYFLTLLGTAVVERAAAAKDHATMSALRSTIGLCVKGVYNQSENFYLATVVAKVLKNKVTEEDLYLLTRNGGLPEVNDDTEDIPAGNITAEWPIPIIGINEDRRRSMIDTLVHTEQGFSHSESAQEGGSG